MHEIITSDSLSIERCRYDYSNMKLQVNLLEFVEEFLWIKIK